LLIANLSSSPPPFSILPLSLAHYHYYYYLLQFFVQPPPTSILILYLSTTYKLTLQSQAIGYPHPLPPVAPITSFCPICVSQSTPTESGSSDRRLSPLPLASTDSHPLPIYPLPTVGEHPRITRLSHLCHFWSFCVLLTRSYLAKKHSLDPCPVVPGRHARNNDAALSVVHDHQLLTSPTTQALCPSGLVALGSGSSPPREEFGLEASLDL
jgi:hypothetical protein